MTIHEYNATVDQHADNLYRFFVKNIGDKDTARDLVQESFAKMWIKVRDVEYDKAKNYLFTVGYRTMIDHIRSKKRRDDYLSKQEPDPYEDRDYDLKGALEYGLNKLPESQKTVILLRDYEGYSYEEIEQITGMSASQVKVYLFRARKAMKEILLKNKSLFPI